MFRALLAVLAVCLCLPAASSASIHVFTPEQGGDDATCHVNLPDVPRAPCATITRAAQLVEDGQSVYVQPGVYPKATITRKFAATTTIRGGAGIADGITLDGAANVYVLGVQSSFLIHVNNSTNVRFNGNEVTDPGAGCVKVSGSTGVTFTALYIHDCAIAFVGSSLLDSYGVTIQDSTLTGFAQDAMQVTHWHGVSILRNTISNVRDPRAAEGTCPLSGCTHNDGIQTAGDFSDVVIDGNDISDVRGQGMLLGRTVAGDWGNITVSNNTIRNDAPYHSFLMSGGVNGRIFGNHICGGVTSIRTGGNADGLATLEVYDNQVAHLPWSRSNFEPLAVLRDENNTLAVC